MTVDRPTTQQRPRPTQRLSMLTYGLLFGPALGMIVALVYFGGDAIASGLVIGAGLGITVGQVLDSVQRDRGNRDG